MTPPNPNPPLNPSPGPDPVSSSALPKAASHGFAPASTYDTHRPSYPLAAVEALLLAMKLKEGRIVEVGCGTGKFTEVLAGQNIGKHGFEILAVEPHEGMRGELVGKVVFGDRLEETERYGLEVGERDGLEERDGWGKLGECRAKVVDGHAGGMPVEGGWGDGCIIAQAFHWFATSQSLREIHRVLRPGAPLGLIWNIESYNQPPSWPTATTWERDLSDMMMALDDGHPRFRQMRWMDVFMLPEKAQPQGQQEQQQPQEQQRSREQEEPSKDNEAMDDMSEAGSQPWFTTPLGTNKVEWTVWRTPDSLWRRLGTLSQIVNMGDEERGVIRKKFEWAMGREDCVRNERGEVRLGGCTYFAWTRSREL